MKICIAGKNEIAVHGLGLAINMLGRDKVMACPNTSDDGISRWQPSLARFAREFNVNIVKLEDIYAEKDMIFLSLEFDKIVRPSRFKSSNLYNIHFSKLPAYKGMYTSAWPILMGERASGVTLHCIDDGIDTGDIIDQLEIEISETHTARDLYFDYMRAAATLLNQRLPELIAGRIDPKPQAAVGSNYYSRSSIKYSELAIDLRNTAEHITRQVRAYHFREFQIPKIGNFPVCNPKILHQRSHRRTGSVLEDGNDAIIVSTIDFDVRFERDRSWDVFRYVEESELSEITKLADHGSLVNATNTYGWTPLIVAAFNGKKDVCSALIEAGADVNKPNRNGTTPLMYAKDHAIRSADFSICKMLLDAGSDLSARDRFGKNLIEYAKMNNESAALKFFGRCGND